MTDAVAYSQARVHSHRVTRALRNAWRVLWGARQVQAELSALSDVELKDLGITRCQIDAVAKGTFSR